MNWHVRAPRLKYVIPRCMGTNAPQLACARIGAVHSVVFGGFSAEALAGRILDSKPRLVVTASGDAPAWMDLNVTMHSRLALHRMDAWMNMKHMMDDG